MSDCDRLLAALKSGPKTHRQLYALDLMAHSRAAELRTRGHQIDVDRDTDRDGRPVWIYTLRARSSRLNGSSTLTVKQAREAKGWSSRELARRAQMSPGFVSLIERGRYVPTNEETLRLSKALGRPLVRRGRPSLRVAA